MTDGLVWEKVVFRQGDGRYTFEIDRGGLHATLSTPHGRSLTIPTVAWYGLIDALAAARRTKDRAERAPAARRHGERWSDAEAEELAASFRGGVALEQLALRHNRSRAAIEAQLSRLGLFDRVTGEATLPDAPAEPVGPRSCSPPEPPWPEPPWPDAPRPGAPRSSSSTAHTTSPECPVPAVAGPGREPARSSSRDRQVSPRRHPAPPLLASPLESG